MMKSVYLVAFALLMVSINCQDDIPEIGCKIDGTFGCQNSGLCVENKCQCPFGYTGKRCETWLGCEAGGDLACPTSAKCIEGACAVRNNKTTRFLREFQSRIVSIEQPSLTKAATSLTKAATKATCYYRCYLNYCSGGWCYYTCYLQYCIY